MGYSPSDKTLSRAELGALALLGGVLAIGLAAQGLTCLESLVAISFLAGVLGIARLWQLTSEQAAAERGPLTRRQWAWQALVFVAWLAVIAVLVWWCVAERAERTQQWQPPAADPLPLPEEPPANDDPPEQPLPPGVTAYRGSGLGGRGTGRRPLRWHGAGKAGCRRTGSA